MFPVILKASEESSFIDNTADLAPAQTQELFPYDEKLENSLCTLLNLVNQDGSSQVKAAFGEFLNYVEGLEKTIKQLNQSKPRTLSWVETGTITVN
jgi:hypothetical protein